MKRVWFSTNCIIKMSFYGNLRNSFVEATNKIEVVYVHLKSLRENEEKKNNLK